MALKIDFLDSIWQKFTDAFNASTVLKEGGSVYDTQISGVQDDGSIEGVMRTKIVSGDLVKVPASMLQWASGPASVRNYLNNNDGSFSGKNISVTAGLGKYGNDSFPFYGKFLGLRFRDIQATPEITVIVDSVAKGIRKNQPVFLDNNRESAYMLFDNLPDGIHTCRIIIHSREASSNSLVVYGAILDSRYYKVPPRLNAPYYKGILTAADVALLTYNSNDAALPSQSVQMSGFKRIWYKNTDGATQKVIISYDGTEIWNIDIPAGGTSQFQADETGIIFGTSPTFFTQRASLAGVINFTVVGF